MADIQKIKVNGTEYDINLGSDKDVAVSSVKAGSITGESSLYVGTTIRPSSGTITNLKVADNKVTLEGVGAENTALVDITVEKNGEMSVAGSVVADKLIASNSISLAGSVITEWPSQLVLIKENINTSAGMGIVTISGNSDIQLGGVTVDGDLTTNTLMATEAVDTPTIILNGVEKSEWPEGPNEFISNTIYSTVGTLNIKSSESNTLGGVSVEAPIVTSQGLTANNASVTARYVVATDTLTANSISVTGTGGITTTKITANSMSADRLVIGNNTILLESTGGGGIVTPNIITPSITLNGVTRTSWPEVSGDITVNNLTATREITASNIRCVGNGINTYINPNGITTPTISVTGTDGITTTKITANAITLGGVTKSSWPSGGGGSAYMEDDLVAGSVIFGGAGFKGAYISGSLDVYPETSTDEHIKIHPFFDLKSQQKVGLEFMQNNSPISYITGSNIVCTVNSGQNSGFGIVGSITINGKYNSTNYPVTIKSDNNVYINGNITIDGTRNNISYPVTITSNNGIFINGKMQNSNNNNKCPSIAYVSTYTSGIATLADMIRNIEYRLATANI